MKICIVVPYDLSREGGVKKHSVHLARSLRQLGDVVDIIGPCSLKHPPDEGMHRLGGAIRMPGNGSAIQIGVFAPPLEVRRFLRSGHYDVIHIHEPLVPALNYWALSGAGRASRVCTFHSFDEKEDSASTLTRVLLARMIYPGYDRGIAVSPAAARQARATWHRPLSLIPNGVPTSIFTPPETEDSDPGRSVRLLFVGHWSGPRKGLPHLLEAYQKLRSSGVPLTLDVIGEGPRGVHPEELPGVTYHGAISSDVEIAQHYRRCDIFVAPATGQESFGIVLLEAMATARAIICSDIEGYRHVIGDGPSGGSARLVPPGATDSLAQAIAELAADPAERRRMGARNRSRALAFDWKHVARQVREEYVAAIAARHPASAQHTALRSPN